MDSPPAYELTIGELFPADDIVSQWVFSLTSLTEDIVVLHRHFEADELREKMFFYRELITRIYEARRLIAARAKHSAIRRFTAVGLTFGGVDLVAAYTRPAGRKSLVGELYEDSATELCTTRESETSSCLAF